ncbi:hypothetical protein NCS57_00877700 [Fusarium keratoplasticum]|uniref:Uncharacterized protein n=1 Tax=Fusarium keratoplasticum TaxID=1328300 RepID=A0ACC0QWB8_9HYPO|nr:hypothetical protein NCS57_00877700 [Fusarium keratoplasticum]KAI8666526.1 hypothetical protein NCS57_00877700 [Fusarium keratoplasticum]KAI8668224.1 hypothetical protein NCS55_00847200 [Fusarium keratoplasticum]
MNQQPPTQNQSQAPDAAGQGEWDEARLEEAMQRLKLLHIKVRLLRDTIPQMIQPLLQKQPSRRRPIPTRKQLQLMHLITADAMFAAYMKSITEAQNNVKEFTELMRDDFSQQIAAQVQKRQAEEPNGIVPWRHQDHPDWFTLDKK